MKKSALRAQRTALPVRAFIWRWKWVGIALLLALLLESGWTAFTDLRPGTVQVAVTKKALYTGAELTAGDLEMVAVPVNMAPASSIKNIQEVLGKSLITPLPPGIPLAAEMLLDGSLREHAPPGMVIIALALSNAAIPDMLQIGDRIDLYAIGKNYKSLAAAGTGETSGVAETEAKTDSHSEENDNSDNGASNSSAIRKNAQILSRGAIVVSKMKKSSDSLLGKQLPDNENSLLVAVAEADAPAVLSAQVEAPLFPVLNTGTAP